MKVSDYIVQELSRRAIRHIFLLPGGGCMHLIDSVGRCGDIEYICCLHEQGCAFAAEAYGEFANRLSCTLVTSGPGGTNTLTGVACAWIESSPCLFLSGQAKRADLIESRPMPVRSLGPQEVDIVSVVRPITKSAVRVVDPNRIRWELERACWLATNGRPGPVWIDLPLDVQAVDIDPAKLEGFVPPPRAESSDLKANVSFIMDALGKAKRPVIYAGNGVRTAGVLDEFRKWTARLGVPVLLSWKASDFLDDTDPHYIGRPGAIGQRAANFVQQKADFVLALGVRLDLPSIAFNPQGFAPKARKILVDIEPAELSKFVGMEATMMCADLGDLFPALAGASVEYTRQPEQDHWLSFCRDLVAKYPVVLPEHYTTPPGYVSTYALVETIANALTETDVLVPGSSGPCSDIFYQAFRVKLGQRILNAPGLGAMGTGLPGTIGACLAAGRRRVVNLNGDGGFQLNIQELETVHRLGLPIKYFIVDNNGYRSIVAMQRTHFQGRLVGSDPTSQLTMPNMEAIAAAYGIKSFTVDDVRKLPEVVRTVLDTPGPVICIVKTSADEKTAPRVSSQLREDGTIVSMPMEDMSPVLDRTEFEAVMNST